MQTQDQLVDIRDIKLSQTSNQSTDCNQFSPIVVVKSQDYPFPNSVKKTNISEHFRREQSAFSANKSYNVSQDIQRETASNFQKNDWMKFHSEQKKIKKVIIKKQSDEQIGEITTE